MGNFIISQRFSKAISAFLRDQHGSISIETVILMPLLLFLTIGGLTYWNAFNSNSRTAKVAYAVSDIMSRHEVVDDVDMAYLFDLQNKMLPGDVRERTLRISSICFENDNYHVLWSYVASGTDVTTPPALTVTDIPIQVMPAMQPQDSVILVELTGSWEPQFSTAGLTGAEWNNALVVRPRFVKFIPHASLNPANICPTSGT